MERLGIPIYTWCVESNSGAGGICVAPGKCQSTFPAAAGLAASFNRTVWLAFNVNVILTPPCIFHS